MHIFIHLTIIAKLKVLRSSPQIEVPCKIHVEIPTAQICKYTYVQ